MRTVLTHVKVVGKDRQALLQAMDNDELRTELALSRTNKEYVVASYISRLLVMRRLG